MSLSEFYIPNDEFWFLWTVPQLMLLIDARAERYADDEDKSKDKGEVVWGNAESMSEVVEAFSK